MKFTENPYYNPKECGLEIFDEVETGGSYEFDTLVIFKKLDDNTLWYAQDSGCSCPTPFESFNSLASLKSITLDTFHGFDEALKNHYNIEINKYIEVKEKVKNYLSL